MTTQELEKMIEKSKERVRELSEKDILTTQYLAYHQGYQDALAIILHTMKLEEAFNEAFK